MNKFKFLVSIKLKNNFMKVKHLRLKRGVCRKCGCTENNACYISDVGTCWWIDRTKTLCSHCFYKFHEKTLDEIFTDLIYQKQYKEMRKIN